MSGRRWERVGSWRKMIVPAVSILIAGIIEPLKNTYYYRMKGYYYEYKIRRTAQDIGTGLSVRGESTVTSKTVLGDHTHFHGIDIRGDGAVTIGDNFHAGSGCQIITHNHNYDSGDAIPYDDTNIRKDVTIGDNVWFGVNVLVLPGVSIGEGAIIQAGSAVVDDIPKGAIAGGHPAEVFSHRDMDHYEALKAEGKFN